MGKILFDEQPIVIDRVLAKEIGLNEAIVIQQIHYWITNNKKANRNFREDKYWTYNSIKTWQEEEFNFWSIETVKRIFNKLVKKGLLLKDNFNKDKRDRTAWYTIDYNKLNEVMEVEKPVKSTPPSIRSKCPNAKIDNATNALGQNDTMPLGQNDLMRKVKMTQPLPETSTETSTEISNNNCNNQKNKKTNDVVVKEVINLFSNNITKLEAKKILSAANNNLDLIKEKYLLALNTNNIKNLVGWIIKAIKNNYTAASTISTFNNFEQRNYDFKKLEKKLLGWD